ncbi:M20/M25/M40 family metallo-hydrolase [Paenibacillus beijingensis]|uniref:Peptidase M20 n=1 Tax=Paenibacillus beijingensis TaxID=1126833 RepID=A0A0D5NJ65_9BACL|nr:M20/M25/M40 family metallo-hydrolase [Paenibacillus beijingensis]AJY75419.1 peptidase M20 [Paenibacillus beijingensis]
MINDTKELELQQQVEAFTDALVRTLSVNGTAGEVEIADQIESILRSFPYFVAHPGQVWTQPLPGDALGRKNVFARIKGRGTSKRTVIFHSHTDTVGISDYGNLEPAAGKPDELLAFFKQWNDHPEIRQQAQSGDWMFGRGALDMKSGVAVHLANVKFFSERPDLLDGDIIFMANPVEENEHSGVIASVDELLRLRKDEGLSYEVAINTDYISPMYPGDPLKYIYTGAVGKLLACFYVYGRETHVGQTLNGLDPTLMTAELNRRINNNMALTEQVEGEVMVPPSALYHRDTKQFYNVQTATSSQLYFNCMVLEDSPKDVMAKLKRIACEAAADVEKYYREQFQTYTRVNGFVNHEMSWEMKVYTYAEYCGKLQRQGVDVAAVTARIVEANPGMELRTLCYEIVDVLRKLDSSGSPCTVLFFAPPYCPHNYLKGQGAHESRIMNTIRDVLERWSETEDESFAVKRFFPYLSDSSYLSLHDTDEEIESLKNNFPEWERIYPVPVEKIRSLGIPAINVGVYGLDAHCWTERVYKPYSFRTVPLLIREMTQSWLQQRSEE